MNNNKSVQLLNVFYKQLVSSSVCCLVLGGLTVNTNVNAAPVNDGELRMVTLNTWFDQYKNSGLTNDFFVNGNYDIVFTQEAQGAVYINEISSALNKNNPYSGYFSTALIYDLGIATRLSGNFEYNQFKYNIKHYIDNIYPGVYNPIKYDLWMAQRQIDATSKLPYTILGNIHLNHVDGANQEFHRTFADSKDSRVNQAKALNVFAAQANFPVLIAGDFNAGDVSERGILPGQTYPTDSSDPTLPDNLPYTMNVLKQSYQLLQNENEREVFEYAAIDSGRVTWPSVGEDSQKSSYESANRWTRVRIDHFIASRPYAKWWSTKPNDNDNYLGVLSATGIANDGRSLSDHEAYALTVAWLGPKLELYNATKSNLIFNSDNTPAEGFYFSRNNYRKDIYWGQVADENGVPLYTGLSESEKATLIDCTDVDVDAEEALVSYCYDTHSFIGQTVIESEALVIVDEDEVFGDPGAKLILRDGGGISLASFSNITLRRELQIDGENPGSITLAEGSSLSFMNDYGIKGSSGLTINGPGQIVMPSTLSLSGTLNVSKTSVLFDGDLSSTSFITIEDSALLQGKGVLPSVSLVGNATLDLQGNLHVSGNLELDSSSALGLKPYTDTDSIVVDGGIKLDDSILNLSIDSIEEIPFDTPIRLIKSKGTIEGEFSEIVASNPDLSVSVSYEDSGIFVTINKADLQ